MRRFSLEELGIEVTTMGACCAALSKTRSTSSGVSRADHCSPHGSSAPRVPPTCIRPHQAVPAQDRHRRIPHLLGHVRTRQRGELRVDLLHERWKVHWRTSVS